MLPVSECCHILLYLVVGYLSVDLCCADIAVSEHLAECFHRNTIGKANRSRERGRAMWKVSGLSIPTFRCMWCMPLRIMSVVGTSKTKPARFPLYRSIIAQAGGRTCTRYGVLVFMRLPLMQSSPSSKTMFSSRRLRTSEIAKPEKPQSIISS